MSARHPSNVHCLILFLAVATTATGAWPSSLKEATKGMIIKSLSANAPISDAKRLEGVFTTRKDGPAFITKDGVEFKVEGTAAQNIGSGASAVRATIDVIPTSDGHGRIEEAQTTGAVEIKAAAAQLPAGGKSQADLQSSARRLEETSTRVFLSNDTTSAKEGAIAFQQQTSDIIGQFLRLDPAERKKARSALGMAYLAAESVRKASANKANYGFNDAWVPSTYPQVFKTCSSVAAVEFSGSVIGTASLIGKNLLLTARHCLFDADDQPLSPSDIQFVFTQDPAQDLTARRYQTVKKVYVGADKTEDWALIEAGVVVEGKVLYTPSGDGLTPLTIDSNRPAKDKPVYVPGYALGRAMMIADGSHVTIPYNLTPGDYAKVVLKFYGEREIAKNKEKINPKLLEADLNARFDESFFESKDTLGETEWLFRSVFLERPAIPAFALDSDTFEGQSGSPVCDRKSSKVIGLFVRGTRGNAVLEQAGFQFHEEAIPISVILTAWKRAGATKPSDYQPSAYGLIVPQ